MVINGHTPEEYSAFLTHKNITPPVPKIQEVEIPLADGTVNVSRLLSPVVFYGPRTISIELECTALKGEWPLIYSALLEDFHGQSVTVTFADDPNYDWIGTAKVTGMEENRATCVFSIEITAQPFKRENTASQSGSVSIADTTAAGYTATVNVTTMRAYPVFTTAVAGVYVAIDDGPKNLLKLGENEPIGMALTSGEHTLTFSGGESASTVTYTLRGAIL